MHATSLQTLVLLVAQAAPGGDFQSPADKIDVPDLLAPPVRTAPEGTSPLQAAPIAPAVPDDRVDGPPPVRPPSRGSQSAPSEFVPLDRKPAETPTLRTLPPARTANGENSREKFDQVKSNPGAPVEFSPTVQLEPDVDPEQGQPAQFLAVRPNPNPWPETKRLIKQAVTSSADSPALPGQPTALRQALARVSDRDERIAVIKTYWRLAVATEDQNHAQDEVSRLANLPEPLDEVERSQLFAALTEAQARHSEAKLVLLATQHELAALMKSGNSTLPVASDVPFVGSYQPRFEEIFSGRTAPANLRSLAESFPLYLELTNARASSVLAAEVALDKLADSYRRGNVAYGQILDAFQKLRDQRIALLATVRDYNNAIADYSLNTVNVGLNTDAVVATLIETEPVPSVLISSGGVRPASAVAPVRTAGQPTPVTRPYEVTPSSRSLVPVARPADDFVPRQVTPTVPSQVSPILPLADPATNSFEFRR